MMFDHLETTEKQLIAQVKAACKALKFIRSVTAEDALPRRKDGSGNKEAVKMQESTMHSPPFALAA